MKLIKWMDIANNSLKSNGTKKVNLMRCLCYLLFQRLSFYGIAMT